MARMSLATLRDEVRAVERAEGKAADRLAAPVLAALSSEALSLVGILLTQRPKNIAELVSLTGRAQPKRLTVASELGRA